MTGNLWRRQSEPADADFSSYCPHCHTGDVGLDEYCGSCGEYIETGCPQCGEINCMEDTHDG